MNKTVKICLLNSIIKPLDCHHEQTLASRLDNDCKPFQSSLELCIHPVHAMLQNFHATCAIHIA